MSIKRLSVVKSEIRILAVDDGKFIPHCKSQVMVVGVIFRGGNWFDGIMSTKITVDGFDATEKISNMIKNSPHYKQLRVILLNGITFAGFNVVDIEKMSKKTKLPVIAVTDKKPNLRRIHLALENLSNNEFRWKAIVKAGKIFNVLTKPKTRPIYVVTSGISEETTVAVLRLAATKSKIPEALRVAHLIASGISLYST